MGFPHGLCTHYKSIDSLFNAISQSDCLRKCFRKYLENFLDCSTIIIDAIISELDEDSSQTIYFSKEMNGLYEKLILNKNLSQKIRPKDCIFTEFKIISFNVDQYFILELYYSTNVRTGDHNIRTRLLWVTTSPTLDYIETPVLSLID